jgi:hypothetical protein
MSQKSPISGGSDPDAVYYQGIEEFFVSRRGDPLFLSNADWLLIRRWRKAGLPLRVVERGIADAMDSHDHSWGRGRKVGSLRYCAAEVDAAAERWRKALSGGQEDGELRRALLHLEGALRASSNLGPSARCIAEELAGEIETLAEENGNPESLEGWLRASETRLLRALRDDDSEVCRLAIEAEVERDLAPYARRLPEKVLAQVRTESIARRQLERHGLPRLSLWSL